MARLLGLRVYKSFSEGVLYLWEKFSPDSAITQRMCLQAIEDI